MSLSAEQGIRTYNGVIAEAIDFETTVEEKSDPITGISYTGSTDTLAAGATCDLATALELIGTQGTLVWTSLTPELAGVSSQGVITAKAAETGITLGMGDGTFGVNTLVSREQMATFLYRYAKAKGLVSDETGDLTGFPDSGQVDDYALEAMRWITGEGIIRGTDTGALLPLGIGTREQVAAILRRFMEETVEK